MSFLAGGSLAGQNTKLLAWTFIAIETLVALAMAVFLMLPMARRSADDLAGLMILSAQTWAELPPETRPAFETELLNSHGLAMRAGITAEVTDEWHPPYFFLLEQALAQRLGQHQHLVREERNEVVWYWADIPVGTGTLSMGMRQERIGARPELVFVVSLIGGLGVAVWLSFWLARRITIPLARLGEMAAVVGQGEDCAPLPEQGPMELALLARRFNQMSRRVRDLLAARTILLAGVSHDLRTPLARIRLAVELMRIDPSPKHLDRMDADVEQMDDLIGNILELARGLEREPPARIHVATFLSTLAEAWSSGEQPVLIRCPDEERSFPVLAMRRALGNLLGNAQRHAPGGPIELVCEVLEGGTRIGVLDRGPGIPAEDLELVFAPFTRLEGSRSPESGGVGLGLAIVRELARANGWQVRLAGRSGGGLEAWIEF